MQTQAILDEALKLSLVDKASIIDQLMASFDVDERQRIDEAWAREAERRIDAYDAGKLSARPVKDVMRDINLDCVLETRTICHCEPVFGRGNLNRTKTYNV